MNMKRQNMQRGGFLFINITVFLLLVLPTHADEMNTIKSVLQSAKKVAISIDTFPDEFVISVSPVRQTLQIIHSSARLAGALISEVQNEHYRKDLQAVVGDLNGTQKFRDTLLETLKTKLSAALVEVPPLGSTAKYNTDREAQQDRMNQLNSKGIDVLLDIKITAGIYGPEGEMFFRTNGKLYDVKSSKTLWRDEFVVTPTIEFKANQSFNTYFNPFKSNMFSPRLTMSKNALTRWTENNGENFKKAEDFGIQLSVAQLCGALQLDVSEDYYFSCGISKLYARKAKQAISFFEKAWNMNKQKPERGNALVVALYKAKKIEEAIKQGEIVIQSPEGQNYPTVYYNLAYILVDKKKNPEKAKEYYQRYLELSGIPDTKLEKKLQQIQKKR